MSKILPNTSLNSDLNHRRENNMTKEEKELVYKELCARLPYSVQIGIEGYRGGILKGIHGDIISTDSGINYPLRLVKPYLRLMSSMTDEERNELSRYDNSVQRTDFFYSHHIDCRFMIEKGLALEAPENMYKDE